MMTDNNDNDNDSGRERKSSDMNPEAQTQSSSAGQPQASEHCVTDRPLRSEEASTGELSKLGNIEVYITKPSDYPHAPSKLLLFLCTGTGIHSVNNQRQADKFAKEGFLVVMPDMFDGDPMVASNNAAIKTHEDEKASVIEQIKLRTAETAKAFMIDMWLARHTAEKVMPRIQKVVESIKEEFADALANGGGLYAVGYCFGGKYVLGLGHERAQRDAESEEDDPPTGEPMIKAGAIAHGTQVTPDDITGLKVPMFMVCVENDPLFPDEVREEGKKFLESNMIEHSIRVYSNVPHGFAVLGEYPEKHIQSAQVSAFDQMLDWLKTH